MTIYIGIDPDVEKSGAAVWCGKQFIVLIAMDFFELIDYLEKQKLIAFTTDSELVVYLEAGWLNTKSNFHKDQGARRRERIAKNIGANHMIGKLLAQFCERQKINCHLVMPVTSKWNADTFRKVTGYNVKINQDVRDAARLVFGR